MVKFLILLFSITLFMYQVSADVIDFEDFFLRNGQINSIPNYKGFNWSDNWYYMNGEEYNYESGYKNGVVSGDYVAFNAWQAPVKTSNGEKFDFNGAYFTAAWNTDLKIKVDGYDNDVLRYSTIFTVNCLAPTWIDLNYKDINELTFKSFHGVDYGPYKGRGTHFVMDDFTFNREQPVPEPTAPLLILSGIFFILLSQKKKFHLKR